MEGGRELELRGRREREGCRLERPSRLKLEICCQRKHQADISELKLTQSPRLIFLCFCFHRHTQTQTGAHTIGLAVIKNPKKACSASKYVNGITDGVVTAFKPSFFLLFPPSLLSLEECWLSRPLNCNIKCKAPCQLSVSLMIWSEPSALQGEQLHFRELWLLTPRVLTVHLSHLSGLWDLKVTCLFSVCVCVCEWV